MYEIISRVVLYINNLKDTLREKESTYIICIRARRTLCNVAITYLCLIDNQE